MTAFIHFSRSSLACVIAFALSGVAVQLAGAAEAPPGPPPADQVPSDRPISDLDDTETAPAPPEQRDASSEIESGPPAPTSAEEAPGRMEACSDPTPGGETVLEGVRRRLAVTACASSAWLDGLFGDQFHYDEYRESHGSVSVGTLWSEYDGLDPRLRGRVRLQLPQWDQRISAFAGRVGEDDYISDTEDEFDALPTRQFEGMEDESVLVGLGYSSPKRTGNDFDAGVGLRVDLPLDPYARARYEVVRTFAQHYVFRARETVFWQNSEGFGSTTRFNIDRALTDRFLLRWNNIGKYTEETVGVEWLSEVTLYQKLNERAALAWQTHVSGWTDGEVPLISYGARLIMRRQLNYEWLFLEVRGGVAWPRKKLEEDRDLSLEAGVALEMKFAG